MHLLLQEEYGLRCLVQLARRGSDGPVSIGQIAQAEGMGREYVAKLLRLLGQGGLVTSTRGARGGYRLSRDAGAITLNEALGVLGRPLFPESFCSSHTGQLPECAHTAACSIRTLWRWLDRIVEEALGQVTLEDLARGEPWMQQRLEETSALRAVPENNR